MEKHEHSGLKRQSFGNPKEVLMQAGIAPGDSVLLDIGAGTGYLTIAAAQIMGNNAHVYALESHEASMRALKKECEDNGIQNISVIHADATKHIPIARDSVDICLMSNVVHGFVTNGEMTSVLKNLHMVHKDDGKLIVIDFQKTPMATLLFGPPNDIRLTPDQIDTIISPYGYVREHMFSIGATHYGMVFKKTCLQNKWC